MLSSCYLKFSCTKYFLKKHYKNGYIKTKTKSQGKL